MSRRRARRGQGGFTLVEVMAAGVALSALFLCLVRGWAVLDGTSLDLQLRQKAVFALNGEIERLAMLYDVAPSNGAALSAARLTAVSGAAYAAVPGLLGSANRLAYGSGVTGVAFTTTSPSSFAATSSSDALVLVYGSGTSTQDFVWLDRPRTIMARLSWVTCNVTGNTTAACWGGPGPAGVASTCFAPAGGSAGAPCQLLTVVLEWPYRLVGGAPVADSTLAGGRLATGVLTLSTIVGRRA